MEVPPPNHVEGVLEFEVNSNLDSRYRRRKVQYLVDWVGYDASDRSWEPVANINHANDAVANFHRFFPSRPRPSVSSI